MTNGISNTPNFEANAFVNLTVEKIKQNQKNYGAAPAAQAAPATNVADSYSSSKPKEKSKFWPRLLGVIAATGAGVLIYKHFNKAKDKVEKEISKNLSPIRESVQFRLSKMTDEAKKALKFSDVKKLYQTASKKFEKVSPHRAGVKNVVSKMSDEAKKELKFNKVKSLYVKTEENAAKKAAAVYPQRSVVKESLGKMDAEAKKALKFNDVKKLYKDSGAEIIEKADEKVVQQTAKKTTKKTTETIKLTESEIKQNTHAFLTKGLNRDGQKNLKESFEKFNKFASKEEKEKFNKLISDNRNILNARKMIASYMKQNTHAFLTKGLNRDGQKNLKESFEKFNKFASKEEKEKFNKLISDNRNILNARKMIASYKAVTNSDKVINILTRGRNRQSALKIRSNYKAINENIENIEVSIGNGLYNAKLGKEAASNMKNYIVDLASNKSSESKVREFIMNYNKDKDFTKQFGNSFGMDTLNKLIHG